MNWERAISRRHRVRRIGFALALACAGCVGTPGPHLPPKVDHLGGMHAMLGGAAAPAGKTAGPFALEPLIGLKHLHAIGPLAGLRGEILVWDGTPFTSRVEGGAVRVDREPAASAAFLVWASVAEWRELEIPEEASTLKWLEAWLPDAARRAGLDATRPFAFRVIGAVEHATIHVADLPEGEPSTPESHAAARHIVQLDRAPVQMLGFHALPEAGARGVYTPTDSNVHIHLRTTVGTTMGHADDFTLAPGARLQLAWN